MDSVTMLEVFDREIRCEYKNRGKKTIVALHVAGIVEHLETS